MSEKTIAQKLFARNATAIAILNADVQAAPFVAGLLADLPPVLVVGPGEPADLIVLFVHGSQELEDLLPPARAHLLPKGALWVAYRKGGKQLHRDSIAAYAETIGMEPVAIISLDAEWSCLRLKVK